MLGHERASAVHYIDIPSLISSQVFAIPANSLASRWKRLAPSIRARFAGGGSLRRVDLRTMTTPSPCCLLPDALGPLPFFWGALSTLLTAASSASSSDGLNCLSLRLFLGETGSVLIVTAFADLRGLRGTVNRWVSIE